MDSTTSEEVQPFSSDELRQLGGAVRLLKEPLRVLSPWRREAYEHNRARYLLTLRMDSEASGEIEERVDLDESQRRDSSVSFNEQAPRPSPWQRQSDEPNRASQLLPSTLSPPNNRPTRASSEPPPAIFGSENLPANCSFDFEARPMVVQAKTTRQPTKSAFSFEGETRPDIFRSRSPARAAVIFSRDLAPGKEVLGDNQLIHDVTVTVSEVAARSSEQAEGDLQDGSSRPRAPETRVPRTPSPARSAREGASVTSTTRRYATPRSPERLLTPASPSSSYHRKITSVRRRLSGSPSIDHAMQSLALSSPSPAYEEQVPNDSMEDLTAINDDEIQPYDPKDEVVDDHEYFEETLQTAIKQGGEIATEAVAALEKLQNKVELHADAMELLEEAKSMAKFRASDSRTIAILGDSGEGKSSLINSLLHVPGLAQTGDAGMACTSVVTEYRHKLAHHTGEFVIEVDYLPAAEIEALVKELVWSYSRPYLPIVQDADFSVAVQAGLERESDLAWSTLEAAFGHHDELTKEFLSSNTNSEGDGINRQLLDWVREIRWPDGVQTDTGRWTSTVETAPECRATTKLFMQDKLWPFTKMIRVYLDSQILQSGVILADLPGLQDTNLARVKATQDYLLRCDNIFVTANILRAVTNQSVQHSIFHTVSRHSDLTWGEENQRQLKLAVVCTKIEELNLKSAKEDYCGVDNRVSEEELARLEANIASADVASDYKAKKLAKKRLKFRLIEARNDKVKEELRRIYAAKAPNKQLDVFCVSNTFYEKSCMAGDREFVEASGVPELRKFCRGITADAQLREAKYYLNTMLPQLLNSLSIWADSRAEAQAELPANGRNLEAKDAVEGFKQKVPQYTIDFRQDLQSLQKDLLDYWIHDQKWQEAAEKKAYEWTLWKWNQYNAWCVHDGEYYTKPLRGVNWNRDVLCKMRLETEVAWDMTEEQVPTIFEAIRVKVADDLKALRSTLCDILGAENSQRPASMINLFLPQWQYKVDSVEAKFLSELRVVRRKASDSGATSYILEQMLPLYRSASLEKGTGKAFRQLNIVNGYINGGNIFPIIGVKVSEALEALAQATMRDVESLSMLMMAVLDKQSNMMLQLQPATDESTSSQTRQIMEEQKTAVKQFGEDIESLEERLKAESSDAVA